VKYDSSSGSDEESSNSDMDPVKDAISSKLRLSEEVQMVSRHDSPPTEEKLDVQTPSKVSASRPRKEPRQPRAIQHPFAKRPLLLKQLLLPEVRQTALNLSQVIRFLVDNDFLEDVELKPGDADNPLIEEVTDSATNSTLPSRFEMNG